MIKSRKAVFIGFLIVMILLCGVFMYNAVIGKRNLEKDLNSSKATDHIKNSFKIGNYILFGKYNNERILWRVINIDEAGSPLLFMENVITIKSYDSRGAAHKNRDRVKFGSNYWENSNIHQWLNAENEISQWIQNPPSNENVFEGSNSYDKEPGFLCDSNFSPEEKKLIIKKTNRVLVSKIDTGMKMGGNKLLKNVLNLETAYKNYDDAYYTEVSDKVRLISIKELYEYVYKRGYNTWRKPTKQALEQNTEKEMNLTTKDYCAYWLRDPDAESSYQAYTAYLDLELSSHYGTYFGRQGIAACLNLDENIVASSGTGDYYNPYLIN
ncbi:DUF6273 domain-containing protein [Acetivibrio cellulolyticus]|uniref:DUF6273 domain-containing protein n=1 Tax=Acetivibrio cellulolyticus TaxID=35830 RepID=UPI0001E304C1|nr:DUF6273 domain-containing protein [Acetivibrio cellulolyticus]